MDNLKKSFLIIALIIGIVAISIVFASLSSRLSISGTANIGDVSWNIHFTNWQLDTESTVTYGGVTHQNTASYPTVNQLLQSPSVAASTKVENLNVTLNQPGDYVKYTFEIINEGSIDATLNNFTYPLTCASGKNCDHLTYVVSCKDNTRANDFVVNSSLNSGERAYCYLQVTYNDQTNNNGVYTQEAVSASVGVNFVFIQEQTGSSQGGNSGSGEQGGSGDIVVPAGSYLITFNANGGSGTMSGQVIDPTLSNTLSANEYTKSGYKFSGWNTNENGSGTAYINQDVIEVNEIHSNTTLYAQWLREGWEFVNESTWNSSTDDLKDQLWRYYRDGQIVQNELIYVNGTYNGTGVSMHNYLIENGYMYIGWHQNENDEWNFYSWFDLDNNGYVEGYRVEGGSMEIDNVTYTFTPAGVASPSPQQSSITEYETTFDGNYVYDFEGAETTGSGGSSEYVSSLNPNATVYLRNDGTKLQPCGVFPTGTVCLDVNENGYEADFGTAPYQLQNLTGYVAAKKDEMIRKGATCSFTTSYGMPELVCSHDATVCYIVSDSEVGCFEHDDPHWTVYSDGDGLIHKAP